MPARVGALVVALKGVARHGDHIRLQRGKAADHRCGIMLVQIRNQRQTHFARNRSGQGVLGGSDLVSVFVIIISIFIVFQIIQCGIK